jgi:hypothetical protein
MARGLSHHHLFQAAPDEPSHQKDPKDRKDWRFALCPQRDVHRFFFLSDLSAIPRQRVPAARGVACCAREIVGVAVANPGRWFTTHSMKSHIPALREPDDVALLVHSTYIVRQVFSPHLCTSVHMTFAAGAVCRHFFEHYLLALCEARRAVHRVHSPRTHRRGLLARLRHWGHSDRSRDVRATSAHAPRAAT